MGVPWGSAAPGTRGVPASCFGAAFDRPKTYRDSGQPPGGARVIPVGRYSSSPRMLPRWRVVSRTIEGSFETRSRGSNAPGAAEPRGPPKILSTQCERLTSRMTLIHTGSSRALLGLLTRMLSRSLYDRDRPSGGPPRQTNKFGSETTFCLVPPHSVELPLHSSFGSLGWTRPPRSVGV